MKRSNLSPNWQRLSIGMNMSQTRIEQRHGLVVLTSEIEPLFVVADLSSLDLPSEFRQRSHSSSALHKKAAAGSRKLRLVSLEHGPHQERTFIVRSFYHEDFVFLPSNSMGFQTVKM